MNFDKGKIGQRHSMMAATVTREDLCGGAVAVLRLNRAEKRNCINQDLANSLTTHFLRIRDDPTVRKGPDSVG